MPVEKLLSSEARKPDLIIPFFAMLKELALRFSVA